MTVKELKERLEQFDDRLNVFACDGNGYTAVNHLAQGVNEADNCLFLDYSDEVDEEEWRAYEESRMECDDL